MVGHAQSLESGILKKDKEFNNAWTFLFLFQGEMVIRAQPTTLLQIYGDFIINLKVILKNILNSDYTF